MTKNASLVAALAAIFLLIPSLSHAKTVKACEEEWKANKATIQASGKKKTEFIAACRAEAATAPTTQAPATQTAPQQTTAQPPRAPAQPAPSTTTTPKAGQYASEGEAKSKCSGDLVVWANTKSKIYHFAGNRNYGSTKSGAYMCEREATAAGMRAAKTEKHP
jgi:uncharacterized membrane protein